MINLASSFLHSFQYPLKKKKKNPKLDFALNIPMVAIVLKTKFINTPYPRYLQTEEDNLINLYNYIIFIILFFTIIKFLMTSYINF